jgi:predicted kinase
MPHGFDNSWRFRLRDYPQSSEFINLFEELKGELTLPSRRLATPLVVSFIGIPGAGKSTLSLGMQEFVPALHLRSDVIGLERLPRGPEYDYYKAYVIQQALADFYLRDGWSVIMDDNNRTRYNREHIYQLTHGHEARNVLFALEVPIIEAVARVHAREVDHKRGLGVRSKAEIHRQLQQFQSQIEDPTKEELETSNVVFRRLDVMQPVKTLLAQIRSDRELVGLMR